MAKKNKSLSYQHGGSSIFPDRKSVLDMNFTAVNAWGLNWGGKDSYRPFHGKAFDIKRRDCGSKHDNLPNPSNQYDEFSNHKRNAEAEMTSHIYRLLKSKEQLSSILQNRIETTFSSINDPKKTPADKDLLVNNDVILIENLREITSDLTKNLIDHMGLVSKWVKSDFKSCVLKSDTSLIRDLNNEAKEAYKVLTDFITYYRSSKVISYDPSIKEKEASHAEVDFLTILNEYAEILESEFSTYFQVVENI